MAFYKVPCVHCGALLERDARFCPQCASRSPFGFSCPSCLRPVSRSNRICSGCGRPLQVFCPFCGGQTFAGERCDRCGHSLMTFCSNPRCGALQFFQNERCTACGKKIAKR